MQKDQLYFGGNLAVLREHLKDESVDLIYVDSPSSRQDYAKAVKCMLRAMFLSEGRIQNRSDRQRWVERMTAC